MDGSRWNNLELGRNDHQELGCRFISFTESYADRIRIISARQATKQERKLYEN